MKHAEDVGAKQVMEKADWECWEKVEEEFKQIHRPFLFDLDDDGQEDTHQDKRIKQRLNVKLLQHRQDTEMLPYSHHLPPLNNVGPAPIPLLKRNGARRQGGKRQGDP